MEGTFLGGNSELLLVCAKLLYVAGPQWGDKKHLNMTHFESAHRDNPIAGWVHSQEGLQTNLCINLDSTDTSFPHSENFTKLQRAPKKTIFLFFTLCVPELF